MRPPTPNTVATRPTSKSLHSLLYFALYSLDAAKVSPIHGDPVFTNIMVNKYGKLKFIDMRGSLGRLPHHCTTTYCCHTTSTNQHITISSLSTTLMRRACSFTHWRSENV